MKNKLISIIVLLLLIPIATAISTSEETSSVSRIVGESPNEILRQLQRDHLNIGHATYYTNDRFNNKKDNILEEQFGNNQESHLAFWEDWDSTDLQNSINNFDNNELFILESAGSPNPLHLELGSTNFYPNDIQNWQSSIETNNPLILLDSPFAGVYLPKEDTFISRLVRDASIIAPTSFNSPQFTRSILCQLADDKTLGDIFKEARNFHYNGGSKSSNDNFIGLVLQSYALYGNPRQVIDMGWSERDKEKIKNYCKNNLDNLALNIEFLEQVGNQQKFRKHIEFQIQDYTIQEQDNFQLITSENTFQNLEYGELVLPLAVRTTHFPTNTIITDFGIDIVENTEDITANIPSYENILTSRNCYENTLPYSIEFENSYTASTQDFIAKISPVEITNCENGNFKIHKKFNYYIDYIPLSPILVKEVNAPIVAPINTLINIDIELMELTDSTENGEIGIYDEDNNLIWEREITTKELQHQATFISPEEEGLYKYTVEFTQNEETLNFKEFILQTAILEPIANIPISISSNQDIEINYFSAVQEDFELKVKYYLSKDLEIIKESASTKTISFGDNLDLINLNNLKKEDKSYTLTLELDYLGEQKTRTYLLNTNNAPIIYIDPLENYYQNEKITIPFSLIDYDNDEIEINIASPFTLTKNSFNLEQPEPGTHTIDYSISDGVETIPKSFEITILEASETQLDRLITTFSDGSLTKTIDFEESGDSTIYLKIPKTAKVKRTQLNIEG